MSRGTRTKNRVSWKVDSDKLGTLCFGFLSFFTKKKTAIAQNAFAPKVDGEDSQTRASGSGSCQSELVRVIAQVGCTRHYHSHNTTYTNINHYKHKRTVGCTRHYQTHNTTNTTRH